MEVVQFRNPSLWYSLLWKDFQQVKSTLLAVFSGVFAHCNCYLLLSQYGLHSKAFAKDCSKARGNRMYCTDSNCRGV